MMCLHLDDSRHFLNYCMDVGWDMNSLIGVQTMRRMCIANCQLFAANY